MRDAGLTVREDDTGNPIGRLEPQTLKSQNSGPCSLVASGYRAQRRPPLTARWACCCPSWRWPNSARAGSHLPFAVEVLGFPRKRLCASPALYIGSKSYTGRLKSADLKLTDARGQTLGAVIEAHAGQLSRHRRRPTARATCWAISRFILNRVLVLEDRKLAVCVVSAIASQTRGRLTFSGKAGHAGTTPMNLRRDSLAGAAEFILFAEKFAGEQPPLVATVGTINVPSGAANVIPGQTVLTLDVRHPNDAACGRAVKRLVTEAQRIVRRRGLELAWHHDAASRHAVLARTYRSPRPEQKAVQGKNLSLVSGAGHDGVVMAELTPIAMLFVRCRDGLSHHPDEYASPKDLRGQGGTRGWAHSGVGGARDRRGGAARLSRRARRSTCISTSPGVRPGRGWQPARLRWPQAVATWFCDMSTQLHAAGARCGDLCGEAPAGRTDSRSRISRLWGGLVPGQSRPARRSARRRRHWTQSLYVRQRQGTIFRV